VIIRFRVKEFTDGGTLNKSRTDKHSFFSLIDFCIYIFETIILLNKKANKICVKVIV
jgi:hypothetical protein